MELPDDADGWLEHLSWVDGILDADGERLSYQRRSVDQAQPRSAHRGIDEKELQRRRSGSENELRPRFALVLTSFL
jgi:hypothetical protein